MNILYLHGYGSSGQSSTVEYLKKSLPDYYHIEAPDIPVDPAEALPFLKHLCEEEHFSVIIGTSMGGMYAHQLPADFARICVNPALHLSEITDVMKVGTFDFFQPRKDGQTQYTITEEIIRHYREMEAHQFDQWKADVPENLLCIGLFGTKDTTVNCREEFARYYPNVQTFEGEHRMNQKVVKNVVLPIIKRLEGYRQKTEKGTICYNILNSLKKEPTNKNTNARKTTKAEHEELMNIMRDIAKKEREAQLAEYQRIINEAEGCPTPEAFNKMLPLAEEGLPEAQCFVGKYHEYYNQEADHKEQAEYWFRQAAEQHYPPAELALGEWLYYGRHTYKTDPECEQWLLSAAEHGEARACYFLGKLAKDKKDMAEACRWWRKGAEGGDEWSQKELAFCYETGQGVSYDLDQTIEWYKRAALHEFSIGNVDACYQIAVLKKYAMEKYADLTGWESECFWEGEKEMLNGNLAQAVDLWRCNSDPRAMVMAAWQLLHMVEGVVEKEGEEYFDDDELFFEEEEAAIEAVAETFLAEKLPAAYYLKGYLYEQAVCYIKPNVFKAVEWYKKAAEAGDEVAAWKVKDLEKEMRASHLID